MLLHPHPAALKEVAYTREPSYELPDPEQANPRYRVAPTNPRRNVSDEYHTGFGFDEVEDSPQEEYPTERMDYATASRMEYEQAQQYEVARQARQIRYEEEQAARQMEYEEARIASHANVSPFFHFINAARNLHDR